MPLIISQSQQVDLPPPGNHLAICFQVIQLGTQQENYASGTKLQKKIRLTFELCEEKKEFKPGDGEKPFMISKEYTESLGKQANLSKDLISWRGKPFTEQELEGFDIFKVIGYPCYLQIIHETSKNGNTYAKINSITSKPKSVTVPPLVNPKLEFSFSEFNSQVLESLPDFVKEKIKKSPEYQEAISGQKQSHFDLPSSEPEDIF